MSSFRLTPRARAQPEDIYDYTIRHWGRAQADNYARLIQSACENIGSCDPRLKPVPRRSNCYMFRAGSHVIVARRVDGGFEVLAILHQSMDLPRRLDEASGDD